MVAVVIVVCTVILYYYHVCQALKVSDTVNLSCIKSVNSCQSLCGERNLSLFRT